MQLKKKIIIIIAVILLIFVISFTFSTIRKKNDKTSILLGKLKSLDFKDSEQAEASLIAMGQPAVKPLQKALKAEVTYLKYYLMIKPVIEPFYKSRTGEKGKKIFRNIVAIKKVLYRLGEKGTVDEGVLKEILKYVNSSYLQENEVREMEDFFRDTGTPCVRILMEFYRNTGNERKKLIFHILLVSAIDINSVNIIIPYLGDENEDIRSLATELLGYTEDRNLTLRDFHSYNLINREMKITLLHEGLSPRLVHLVEPINIFYFYDFLESIMGHQEDSSNKIYKPKEFIKRIHQKFKNTDAVPHLIKALDDSSVDVQINAIRSLGLIGDNRASAAVARFLKKGNSEAMLDKEAIIALGLMGDKTAVKPLLNFIDTYSNGAPGLREYCRAVFTLGLIGDSEAVEPLVRIAVESCNNAIMNNSTVGKEKYHWEIRANAIIALGFMGDKRAVGPLIKILKTRKGMYPIAAFSLGMLKDRRALEPMKSCLRKLKEEEKSKPKTESDSEVYGSTGRWIDLFEWAVKKIESTSPAKNR